MAYTTVSDWVIWAKHVHGDPTLAQAIRRLEPGQAIRLRVEGVAGRWRKMDRGRDGRSTDGVRPLGEARVFWRELYKARRLDVVDIELDDPSDSAIRAAPGPASKVERDAALDAFLSLAGQGWRSDGDYGPRDELYDR